MQASTTMNDLPDKLAAIIGFDRSRVTVTASQFADRGANLSGRHCLEMRLDGQVVAREVHECYLVAAAKGLVGRLGAWK